MKGPLRAGRVSFGNEMLLLGRCQRLQTFKILYMVNGGYTGVSLASGGRVVVILSRTSPGGPGFDLLTLDLLPLSLSREKWRQ